MRISVQSAASARSADGNTWKQVGTAVTVSMAQTIEVGLVVGNNSGGALETATFDNAAVLAGTTTIVSSVAPTSGGIGTAVTINGSNFGTTQSGSTVSFNGAVATSITSWSDTQIVALVPDATPNGAGPVTVTVNGIASNGDVVFTTYHPVITTLEPPGASVGASVFINGSGFTSYAGTVQVGSVAMTVQSWTDTRIRITVPSNAVSGPLTVTTNGITSNAAQFTLENPPAVTSFTPTTGEINTSVTITGSGFGATQSTSTAAFFGIQAQVTSWSETQIVATLPSDAITGPITVTVAGVSGTSTNAFVVTFTSRLWDSFGRPSTYTATVIGGKWYVTDVTGSGCSTCTLRGNRHIEYDGLGNIVSETNALNQTTSYTYDANNNMTSESFGGATTSYTYNNLGEPLTVTDPLGNVTTNTYDANGNLLTVTTPEPDQFHPASVTQLGYDSYGGLVQITDPNNHVTMIGYTPSAQCSNQTVTGLVASITDANSKTTNYCYDGRGNRTDIYDALNNHTAFQYDAGHRLTEITYPDGSTVSYHYEPVRGRLTQETDQNGSSTIYTYDDADRLVLVTDALLNITTYAYDTESNLLSLTDANQHTTSYAYDAFGRVIQTMFPSTLTESYNYDAIGNLTSKTDRKNQTITYVYNALNQLTHIGYPDATGVDYVYDLIGKIQHVNDPSGNYGFAYDKMGRLVGTTTQYSFLPGRTFTNSYTYDAASNRKSMTDAENGITNYSYDALSRLTNITDFNNNSFGFAYDDLSRRTLLTRPNGVNTSYTYDNLSRLLSVLHQLGGATLDGASYGFDLAGNRTSKTDLRANATSNYSYDKIYQLLQAVQGATTTESYTHDPVGNRLSSSTVSSYVYNSSNELTSTSSGSYTYDNDGNALTDANGRSYTWDINSRLSQVTVPGTGAVTFKYDSFGRRIERNSSSGTTVYLYDGNNIIEELDANGNPIGRYSQGPGIDRPLGMTRAGVTSFYQQDTLGSITSLTSAAGAITDTYTYDAFGNLTASSGNTPNPFRYTGREFDAETGLYYYRARYYDPTVGRFLNEDRLQFVAGVNFYAYVGGSPTNLTDPSGLAPNVDHDKLKPKPWDFREIIIDMLEAKNNNACQCWFKTGKKSIQQLIDIIATVPINLVDRYESVGGDTAEDPDAALLINAEGPFYPGTPYHVGRNPDRTPIFAPGTFEAQMVILLHELAHKTNPEGFVNDNILQGAQPDDSEKNTSRVIEHCIDEIYVLKFKFKHKYEKMKE
jgi:RHS repeat-associated protein